MAGRREFPPAGEQDGLAWSRRRGRTPSAASLPQRLQHGVTCANAKVTWPAAETCQTADEPGAEPFLGARFAPARRRDRHPRTKLETARSEAQVMLAEHRVVVEALRDALLDRHEVVGDEILEVVRHADPATPLQPPL